MEEDRDRQTTDYDDQPEAHEVDDQPEAHDVDDQPKRGPRPIQYLAPQSPSGPAPFPPQSPQHHQNNYPNQPPPQQQYPPQNPPPFPSQQPPYYYQQQPQQFPPQNNYANAAPPAKYPPASPSQPLQMQGYNGMPPQQQQPYPELGGYNKPNYQSPQPQQQQYQPQQPQPQPQPQQNYNYASSTAQGVPTNNYTPQGMAVRPMNGMQPFGTEPWQTGLFDCMDDPNNAIITLFVPCVTYGQIAEVVDNGTTSCATSGLIYGLVAVFTWVPFIMSCTYRTKIRSKYGLVETPAPDWVTHLFCDLCALCQEYRELNIRGLDPSIGWQGNMARSMQQQQQQQPNMMAPPPNHMMR